MSTSGIEFRFVLPNANSIDCKDGFIYKTSLFILLSFRYVETSLA